MATSLHNSPPPNTGGCLEPGWKGLAPDKLIQECAAGGNAAGWEEFIRRFYPMIAGVVARTAMRWTRVSPELVHDLVQETYLKLCTEEYRCLRRFSSRHEQAAYGFLKTVAGNAATDYFTAQFAIKRGGETFREDDLDSALQKAQEGCLEDRVLLREIGDFLDQITQSEQDKRVFDLYFRQGFTAKEIAHTPGMRLSEKGVESCIYRLKSMLRDLCRKPAPRTGPTGEARKTALRGKKGKTKPGGCKGGNIRTENSEKGP